MLLESESDEDDDEDDDDDEEDERDESRLLSLEDEDDERERFFLECFLLGFSLLAVFFESSLDLLLPDFFSFSRSSSVSSFRFLASRLSEDGVDFLRTACCPVVGGSRSGAKSC